MNNLSVSVAFVAFLCLSTVNSNPILNLFGKGGEDKAEVDDKAVVAPAAKTAAEVDDKAVAAPGGKAVAETTTTTTTPGSSCGGLKGFLHLCEKAEPTEPPKNVKTRSVPENDSTSEEDSDSDSDEVKSKRDAETTENEKESSPGLEEDTEEDEEGMKPITTKTNDEKEESAEKTIQEPYGPIMVKRQAKEDDEEMKTDEDKDEETRKADGEVDEEEKDGMEEGVKGPIQPPELMVNPFGAKRQVNEDEEKMETLEMSESKEEGKGDLMKEEEGEGKMEDSRKRRDCRDRYGDYEKDCRKKREMAE